MTEQEIHDLIAAIAADIAEINEKEEET